MKIEIEVDNITTLLDGLNNAILAYNDAYTTAFLGLEVPYHLQNISEDKMKERLEYLIEFYKKLLKYEK